VGFRDLSILKFRNYPEITGNNFAQDFRWDFNKLLQDLQTPRDSGRGLVGDCCPHKGHLQKKTCSLVCL